MNVVEIIAGMIEFAAQYCLAKCVRTMLAGMLALLPILLIRKCNRGRRADVNFYAMLFLLPMAFTGMNKLFFLKYIAIVNALICWPIKPVHGEIYFGVMTALLARFLRKNYRLEKRVRALQIWQDGEELAGAVSLVTAGDRFPLQRRYLDRVRVYLTEEKVSPFSGGMLHPFVVMPREMLTEWPEDERRIVLCHELTHLRSGHVVWTFLFQLLKIYWWINPMIYLCDKLLREDMEIVCDEKCIRYANVSCGTYGRALISMIALMQGAGPEGTLCFSENKDFLTVKRRIGSLTVLNDRQRAMGLRGGHRVIFAGLFIAAFVTVAVTSYPRYTRLDDIVLYDEDLTMLDYDSEELRGAVTVSEGRLTINQEHFSELLAAKDIKGEYVFVSFDTIMKVPGSGGCGNVGMVAVSDCSDIFYLSAECLSNDIEEFWLKYLI